jgi:hypothetical protein
VIESHASRQESTGGFGGIRKILFFSSELPICLLAGATSLLPIFPPWQKLLSSVCFVAAVAYWL